MTGTHLPSRSAIQTPCHDAFDRYSYMHGLLPSTLIRGSPACCPNHADHASPTTTTRGPVPQPVRTVKVSRNYAGLCDCGAPARWTRCAGDAILASTWTTRCFKLESSFSYSHLSSPSTSSTFHTRRVRIIHKRSTNRTHLEYTDDGGYIDLGWNLRRTSAPCRCSPRCV